VVVLPLPEPRACVQRPATQDRDSFVLHLCAIMSGLSSQAAASAMSVYILKHLPGAGDFMESAALQGHSRVKVQPRLNLAVNGWHVFTEDSTMET
jgi:hypothetical protein